MIYLSLRGVASKWRELLSAILVMFLLWNHAIAQTPASKETTLQDAINARTEVTVLAQEVAELDKEIFIPMRKVIARGEAQQMAANILLTKDKYAESVKSYNEAAGFYRQALEGRKLLERLAEAQEKTGRVRMLAETTAKPESLAEVKRIEINAEGYIEAAEFEKSIAEFEKARKTYESLISPGKTATLEEAVAARTAMLSARKQVKDIPPFNPDVKKSLSRKSLSLILSSEKEDIPISTAKKGSLPDVLERAYNAENGAAIALEERDYTPAQALFAQAEKLYREAATLQTKRTQVAEGLKTAEDSMKLANDTFKTEARPASFELGKQLIADGSKALEEEELDKAKQLFAQAVEKFARAREEADTINALAEAQGEWSAALAEADDALLDKYAVESRDAAKKLAAEAETKAAVGDAALAMSRYRMAVKVLKEASAKALTAENTTKAAPVVSRLEATMAGGDKFAAEDTLAELEKLIPSDSRMPGFREKVAAMPGPEKAETYDLGGGVKLEMILIRPGYFMMGSDKGYPDEKPAHKVKITKPFYMGKFEVTQAQYQAVMGSNPSRFKSEGNLPVEMVSWDDCQEFLKKLNEKIPGKELRLPTEAEWEFACRAGSTTEYCFGDDESILEQYAWYSKNSESKTHPVGGKKPNAWGLYDMHGNVWEWCNDYFGDKYYESSPAEDPKGADSGAVRVLRGGSWDDRPRSCRSAYRYRNVPSYRCSAFGFRVSCSSSAR